jgi:hypothetical protein
MASTGMPRLNNTLFTSFGQPMAGALSAANAKFGGDTSLFLSTAYSASSFYDIVEAFCIIRELSGLQIKHDTLGLNSIAELLK